MIQEVKLNKLIVIGILFLFVCISVYPISGFNLEQSSGNTITVDNEGDGDFTSIKQALNNANQGDSIEVYSGTYYEHDLSFEKEGIILQGISHELGNGVDTGKPIIDGEGKEKVFFIKVSNIIIDGFNIHNDGPGSYNIISIATESNNCTIINNNLSNSVMSILYVCGYNIKILNNTINHSYIRFGISLDEHSRNCLISGNTISNAKSGVLLWDSNNHIIVGNRISMCSRSGIDVSGDNNNIIGNHIENNIVGIDMGGFNNHVKRNNFIKNNIHMRFIYGSFTSIKQRLTNRWYGNYWGRPRLLPYPVPGGIFLIPTIQFDWRPALIPYDI